MMEQAPNVIFRSAGFVKASLDDTVLAYRSFLRHVSWWQIVRETSIGGSLAECKNALEPLRTPYDRCLFLRTDSDYIAFVTNDRHQFGCAEHLGNIVRFAKTSGLHVTCGVGSNDQIHANVKMQIYEYCDDEADVLTRSVGVVWTGRRYEFGQYGSPKRFEDIERYSERVIAERFSADMLGKYLDSYGIRLWDEAFYQVGPELKGRLIRL